MKIHTVCIASQQCRLDVQKVVVAFEGQRSTVNYVIEVEK